ncbi:MAG TPA: type II toxin-antitoxin system VapC family toxin [Allosphingosinicella sp.]|jgi:predicted nucleic acid-binding protein
MIIDASVAFKLVVEEPGSDDAIGWIGRTELIAPALLHAEVANGLWKRVQKNELSGDAEIGERLADLARYVRTVEETPFMADALRLAIELRHPVYDCIYLALAEGLQDEMITADRRFLAAVAGTAHASRVRELGSE